MNLSDLNNLDFNDAGRWPAPVKAVAVLIVVGLVAGLGYYLDTSSLLADLDRARFSEQQLRDEFERKRRVTANIETYQAQIDELRTILDGMIRQLPTRTEMPDLLEDISNIGRLNGLNFELFKPEDERPQDFYAAKPITIRAKASYHQFGAFVSSVAALPRIVTLENMVIESPPINATAPGPGSEPMTIKATLQTYRYLDDDGLSTDTGKPGGAKKT